MEAWKGKMVTNEEGKIVTSVLVSGIAGKERTGKDLRARRPKRGWGGGEGQSGGMAAGADGGDRAMRAAVVGNSRVVALSEASSPSSLPAAIPEGAAHAGEEVVEGADVVVRAAAGEQADARERSGGGR
jgi:hypothetical protein